ncbi:MAG: hypothetical protein HN348_21415, partial [Proteobacteria bacterium]|nr:hypothetical protein [Pseudomonadota bacterium]
MRGLVLAIVGLFWVPTALAQSIVVWMEPEVPDEKLVKKSDNRTGGTEHLAWSFLKFPPQPPTEKDAQDYVDMRQAVLDGKQAWDQFEVEYPIAVNLEEIIANIDLIRDDRDLKDLVDARLFQGAAV